MRLFNYLSGSKMKVAGAGLFAVAVFGLVSFFAVSPVHAASSLDQETDSIKIFKTVKFYQAIKACAEGGQYKTTITGDDVAKGPRWWVADTKRITIGIAIDNWGDKNGITSCAGDDDNDGWQDAAYELFGYDPNGGESTLKKMGYSCSTVNNQRECKKDDINGTILGLMKNSAYLKGSSIDNTGSQLYKVASYSGGLASLKGACEAKAGGNTNLYSLSVVQEGGTIKKSEWSINKSGTVAASVDPLTDMVSNTDSCRSTLVSAVNDNAATYAAWQSQAICKTSYPQIASDTAKLKACGEGRANATNVTFCVSYPAATRGACFLGAGNPVDANGKTAGELCNAKYSGNTANIAACINGAMHLNDQSYCNTTYPAPDNLNGSGVPNDTNKTKREACAFGAALSVEGGGVVLNDSDNPEDPATDDTATACVVDGIGWMVCPLLNALGGLSDAMYGWIDSVLRLQPLTVTNGDGSESPQFVAWQNIRNIANVLLVIAFLVIIFSQLTSMGVSNYGVKKTLPRLIIVALAINTSFYLMAIAVDLTNIIGVGLHSIFSTLAPDATAATMNANEIIGAFVTGTGTVAVAGTAVAIAAGTGALSMSTLALMALPVVGTAVLALLAAVATLFIRNALIVILIVISPLAFAAYLLPNTQGMFTKWRKLFVSMLVLFPMAALLFGGAKFAASVVVVSDQPLSALAAIFIMAAPLGMLPWLVKSSNSLLGNIGGKLGGLARRARNPLNKAVEGQVNKQREAYRAGQKNFWGRKQKAGKTNVAQRWNNRRTSRNVETENLKGRSEENWREMAISGTGGGKSGKAAARASAALEGQQEHTTRKTKNDARAQELHTSRINTAGSTMAAMDTEGREAKLGTARNEAQTQQRFDQHVQANQGLTQTLQDTRRAEETSKTVKAEQDHAFEQLKSTDPTLRGLRDRQADAQLKTTALAEQSAVETQRRQKVIPGLLDVRLATEANKKERGALDQEIGQMVAEASSAKGGAELIANGVDAATVLQIQNAQVQSAVATSATAAAQRVQQGELTEAIKQNTNGIATDMAGIDDTHGEALVTAQAIESQRKAYESNVTAYSIQHRDSGVGTTALSLIAQSKDAQGNALPANTYTTEEREAAGRAVVDSGNIDEVKPYIDYLSTALANASTPEEEATVRNLQKAFGEKISSSPAKPMGLGPGEIEALRNGEYATPSLTANAAAALTPAQIQTPPTSLQSANGIQTFNTLIEKGVSADAWSSMDKNDMYEITSIARDGVLPQARKDTMIDSIKTSLTDPRISVRIKERERKILRDLYSTLGGDVTELPANIQNIP